MAVLSLARHAFGACRGRRWRGERLVCSRSEMRSTVNALPYSSAVGGSIAPG